MTRTNNYDLIVVEGSDKVNLLTQMNPNTEKIDEVLKNNENSGVHTATELLSGTIHALTRTVKSASMFKFTAISNYTAGDTFTVDGVQVTALLTSGEALGTGAYIIGSEVLCSLKDTLLTVYTQGGTVKLADDSEKLGGNLPEYYAKQNDLNNVKSTANNASSLSRQNSDDINNIKLRTFNKCITTVGTQEQQNILIKKNNVVTVSLSLLNMSVPYGNSICTIPENYRPLYTFYTIGYCNFSDGTDGIGLITIDKDGSVKQEIKPAPLTVRALRIGTSYII